MQKEELEKYLWSHIPISKAMGVSVEEISLQKIILKAPLINNINHKSTVFGGSLHAVATLSCWSLVHINLKDLGLDSKQIVIAHSEIFYLQPVVDDFKVECSLPKVEVWDRFQKCLRKQGKARIELEASLLQNNQKCVAYKGTFVAL
jgi:thioesterase domain-containing protein